MIVIRVRYVETDQMGVVHHSSYVQYLEVARIEFLRGKGFIYKEIEENGILLPVLNLEIKYIYPAFYDDLLHIEVIISEIKGARIFFEYKIFNEGRLISTAKTTLAFISKKSKKPIVCPDWFYRLLF